MNSAPVFSPTAIGLALSGLLIALVVSVCQAALTAPTTLICGYVPGEPRLADEAPFFDLDETAGTVTRRTPAFVRPGVTLNGQPYVEPATSEVYRATFAPKSVTFSSTFFSGGTKHYHAFMIDRLTGIIEYKSSHPVAYEDAAPKDRLLIHYSCQVGKPKF